MTWAHVNKEGLIDWTSDVEQDGLVQVKLPAIGERDRLYFKDGKARIERHMMEGAKGGKRPSPVESLAKEARELAIKAIGLYPLPSSKGSGQEAQGGVTVLIPCCGKAAWVRETVDSVLAQTRLPDAIKVLLMDADSRAMKDELEALSSIIRCERAERMDVVAARNYLAEQCGTEFFAFLDADDILQEDFLEKALSDEADFILTPFSRYEDGSVQEELGKPTEGNLAAVCRKSAFLALGGLDAGFAECGHEDTDFILSVLESGFAVRVEWGTRCLIRRDNDEEWRASSFTCSEPFIARQAEAIGKILEKHRNPLCASLAAAGLAALGTGDAAWKNRPFLRYLETGDDAHLRYILKKEHPQAITEEILSFINSCGTAGLYAALPGRDFAEAQEFAGGFEGWRFLNCEPTDKEKATIAKRVKGRAFDVLFLDATERDAPTFMDIVLEHDAALVNASLQLENESGAAFVAEAMRNYFCAFFPLYRKEIAEFSGDGLLLAGSLAGAETSLLEMERDSFVKEYEAEWGDPMKPQPVTFELGKDCNRECAYCPQVRGRPYPKYSDEEMYGRFDKMLARVEALAHGNIKPQLMGGEPALWSDGLVRKILKRLKDCPQIVVLTNRDIRTSAWEEDKRVVFYWHVVDWHDAGKIDIAPNERPMLVVTREDMDKLEAFMKANAGQKINFVEYDGNDEAMRLTPDDRTRLAKLKCIYCEIDAHEETPGILSDDEGRKFCREGKMRVWQANCTSMAIASCCRVDARYYRPYEEFCGQALPQEACADCQQWGIWLRMEE